MLYSIGKIIESEVDELKIDITAFTDAKIDYTIKNGQIPRHHLHNMTTRYYLDDVAYEAKNGIIVASSPDRQ
jgi:hypothetical protein